MNSKSDHRASEAPPVVFAFVFQLVGQEVAEPARSHNRASTETFTPNINIYIRRLIVMKSLYQHKMIHNTFCTINKHENKKVHWIRVGQETYGGLNVRRSMTVHFKGWLHYNCAPSASYFLSKMGFNRIQLTYYECNNTTSCTMGNNKFTCKYCPQCGHHADRVS